MSKLLGAGAILGGDLNVKNCLLFDNTNIVLDSELSMLNQVCKTSPQAAELFTIA